MRSRASLGPRERRSILGRFVREIRELRERRNRIKDESLMAGFGVLAIVLAAATAAAFALKGNVDAQIRFIEEILAGGGAHLALLPLAAGYLRAEWNTRMTGLLFSSRNHGIDSAVAFVLAMGIAALFVALPGAPAGRGDPVTFAFTLAAAATAGPALEEVVFRHLLFTVLGRRTGTVAAAALSSALFAAIHLPGDAYIFFAYFASGAALCAVRHLRRSLFPALAAHALANVVILIS